MSAEKPRWLEQWERVGRRYEWVKKTHDGRVHDRDSEHYMDEAYSFFMDCFHLKDWLKNDPASGMSRDEAEAVVANSLELRICADLANGAKHLDLTTSRTDTKVGVKHINVTLTVGEEPIHSSSVEIHAGGKTYMLYELATACRDQWQAYLQSKGLLKAT